VPFQDVDVSVELFSPSTDTDFVAVIVTSMFRYEGDPTPALALPAKPRTASSAAPSHFAVVLNFISLSLASDVRPIVF
jgi:hypothetical protein